MIGSTLAVVVCKRDRNLPPSHGSAGVFLHTIHHYALAPPIAAQREVRVVVFVPQGAGSVVKTMKFV